MPDPPLYTPDDPDPDPAPVITGPAPAPLVMTGGVGTNFADPKDRARYFAAKQRGASEKEALSVGDPGIGSPALGTVNTAQAYGVAIPEDYMRKTFGDDPANWRSARVQISLGDKTITVPIVDVGPGKTARARGVVSDMTDLLWKGLGVGGENPQVKIKLLAGSGPDYASDRQAWDAEQKQIAAALAEPLALGSPAPTPSPQQSPSSMPIQAAAFPATTSMMSAQADQAYDPHSDMEALSNWLSTATI